MEESLHVNPLPSLFHRHAHHMSFSKSFFFFVCFCFYVRLVFCIFFISRTMGGGCCRQVAEAVGRFRESSEVLSGSEPRCHAEREAGNASNEAIQCNTSLFFCLFFLRLQEKSLKRERVKLFHKSPKKKNQSTRSDGVFFFFFFTQRQLARFSSIQRPRNLLLTRPCT